MMLVKRLHPRCYKRRRYSGSSAHLGPGGDVGVATGTSAGDASSGEGTLESDSSSSEVSGDGVGEGFTSSGDALGGKGASEGVELESLGRIFSISCLRLDWN